MRNLDEVQWGTDWRMFFIGFLESLNLLPLIDLHGPERFTIFLVVQMSLVFGSLDLIISF